MRRWLKRIGLALLALLVLAVAAVPAAVGIRPIIGPKVRPLTNRTFDATPERLERGRLIATATNGCLHCHSELDWDSPGIMWKAGREGSGKSWAAEGLPWLTVPNLTPDRETGAGTWTDDMFARAIREGISHDGRTLFPLMPYEQYRYMSDEDLASVVVYLRSLPAIRNPQPPTDMPFPLSRLVNSAPEPVTAPVPEPNRQDPVAYGDYLVRMGACRDCHTPMVQGERITALDLGGGFVLSGPYGQIASSNITPDPSGIPYYTEELFLEMMRTGQVKARKIHDQMPWAMYGRQPDENLKAIFAYLKAVAPVQHRVDNTLRPSECPRCGLTHGGGTQNRGTDN